jgi:hypothetical protein
MGYSELVQRLFEKMTFFLVDHLLLGTLPFENLTQRMKIDFVYFMVLWMNAFPVKSGVSDKISPGELLLRW